MSGDPSGRTAAPPGRGGLAFLVYASRPWRLLFSRVGTVGVREARNPLAFAAGHGGMLLLALLTRSDALLVALGACVISQAAHAAAGGRLAGHSRSVGDCIARGDRPWAAVALVAFLAAWAATEYDLGPLSLWLIVSGVGTLATDGFLGLKEAHKDHDLSDAMYEARERQARVRERYRDDF